MMTTVLEPTSLATLATLLADVDYDAVAHHLAGDGSAASSRDEMGFLFACFLNEIDNILFIFWECHALWYFTIGGSIGGVRDAM